MRRDNRGPAISPWAKDALAGVALAIFVGALIFLQFVSGAAH
jgi:hypothetical protein